MRTFTIDGNLRTEVGKKATKADRVAGRIPCVIYGGGKETIHFTTTLSDIRNLVYTPNFYQVEIKLADNTYNALLKDISFHPTTDNILHIDFQQLVPGVLAKAEIPIKVVGTSPGVRQGGKLLVKVRKLKVKSLPEALKDEIEINISKLKLGQSVKVKNLPDQGFEIINSANIPIVSVEIPRAARQAGLAAADDDDDEE
ncbi:MAG: 50S ribosomal protein L25/general stress protein Ctc [Chitinophagales bacterium]|nr:50S ribosomal protein L25/general stress protein Ctc [Chitinophagales bacterium]